MARRLLQAALLLPLLAVGGKPIASILFKNQCGVQVSIYDGDERFCDVRNGSSAAPTYGCATNLPDAMAEYSHTGAANATKARFMIDDATNNTYYELSDAPGENATTGFNVALGIRPLLFVGDVVGSTLCANISCLEDGCATAYHSSNDTTGKTYGCPQGEVFVLTFCPTENDVGL